MPLMIPAGSIRIPSDGSSQSSTNMQKFSKAYLSDQENHDSNKSASTAQTSTHEHEKPLEEMNTIDQIDHDESLDHANVTPERQGNPATAVKQSQLHTSRALSPNPLNSSTFIDGSFDFLDNKETYHKQALQSQQSTQSSQEHISQAQNEVEQDEDHEDSNSEEEEEEEEEDTQHFNDSILGKPSPRKIIRESSYQNKLKYLENQNFQGDRSTFYPTHSITSSPSQSIPNTFKYKSHPNAKTKSSIGAMGVVRNENLMGIDEVSFAQKDEDLKEPQPSAKPTEVSFTPPIKTSTVNAPDVDFNVTPDWMPTELTEKWVPLDGSYSGLPRINDRTNLNTDSNGQNDNNIQSPQHKQALDMHAEFNSSVRITRSNRNNQLDNGILEDLNLDFGGGGSTMIHNSLPSQKGTPMWKKATRDYEMQKQSQPNLQNIFMSMDSSDVKENKEVSNANNTSHGANSHSISSTLSTPMASMSNHNHNSLPQSLNKEQVHELEENLEEHTKKSYRFPKHPESPLKLFGDNYNTYTTDKLNGLLLKMNNRSTFQTPNQGHADESTQLNTGKNNFTSILENSIHRDIPDVPEVPEEQEQTSEESQNNESHEPSQLDHSPKLRIKQFTRTGSYTEEQFLQNANNVFKNIQKRGFRMNNDSNPNFAAQASNTNTHTTATSTPKNLKVIDHNDPILLQAVAQQDEDAYTTFSSDFEDTSESNFQQLNTEGNNDFTSFDHSSKRQSLNGPEQKRQEFGTLTESQLASMNHKPRATSYDNDSSYTFDDLSEDFDKTAAAENFDSASTKNSEPIHNNNTIESPYDNGSHTNFDSTNNSFVQQEITINHKPSILQNSTRIFERVDSEKAELSNRVEELEKLMQQFNSGAVIKQLQSLAHENMRLQEEIDSRRSKKKDISVSEISIDNADFTQNDLTIMQNLIKWKRASQLKLSQSPKPQNGILKERNVNQPAVIKGRVKPGIDLPVAYDNMVLDVKNQKWVTSDDKENYAGSLDSIEDLISRSEDQDMDDLDDTYMKAKINNKRINSKLEVSFHLPHTEANDISMLENESFDERNHLNVQSNENRFRSPLSDDVTQISQLDDLTFSLTQKKLVSVVTDILSIGENFEDVSWNEVTEISLANYQLDSIKDLNKFLPMLTSIDISRNEIKFLDGLPKTVLNLNVSENNIEGITSFYQYRDLQRLNASHNRLVNLTNFSRNIHLTELDVTYNRLNSINGVNTLTNLTKLNVSQNEIKGDISFRNFQLLNLQELNMSDNKITSLVGLENLPNLRVLNVNENQLHSLRCSGRHIHLKKLVLKFNSLTDLEVENFPALRVLRIDGNSFTKELDFKRLKYLEEVSCKSQHDNKVLKKIFESSTDVSKLDLSGNADLKLSEYTSLLDKRRLNVGIFLNVRVLVLSAMNLTSIPRSFAKLFPNLRELNLNFNRLNDIQGLAKLKNIKKLYAVSNNITMTETIISGLVAGRSKLMELDLRLNPCNIELYPYVFNPQELEFGLVQQSHSHNKTENMHTSPIQLETLDDIENFAIHYESLAKSVEDWTERDTKFISKLINEQSNSKVKQRLNYETLLINFFKNLVRLDGGVVTEEKRMMFTRRFQENELNNI